MRRGSAMRSLRLMLVIAFRADAARTIVTLVPLMPLSFTASLVTLRILINAMDGGDRSSMVVAAVLFVGTIWTAIAAGFGQMKVRMRLNESVGFAIDQRLIELTTAVPDLEPFERPDLLDRLEYLRTQRTELQDTVGSVAWAVYNVAGLVILIGLLFSVHPLLALGAVGGVPALVANNRAQRRVDDAMSAASRQWRESLHVFDLATTAEPAGELRVFGAEPWLIDRYRDLTTDTERGLLAADLKAAAARLGAGLAAVAAYAGVIALTLWLLRTGRITGGEVFLVAFAAASLLDRFGHGVAGFGNIRSALYAAERLSWLIDYSTTKQNSEPTVPLQLTRRDGIVLRDVSYRYHGADDDALRNIDLTIPWGAVVGLVGENGAGKTTLVKLFYGLNQPTKGAVLIDGVDLATVDRASWRVNTSACFQDHARVHLPARESIAVSRLDAIGCDELLHDALGRAAAEDVLAVLPDGLDTMLGSTLGGIDLSGGQWQKISISRALLRTHPALLVLDEPSSALDPLAEQQLFERYSDIARGDERGEATITVIIAHRFSSVRIADLIVVLHEGRLVDAGTHDELMDRCPHYADLYQLQAAMYG